MKQLASSLKVASDKRSRVSDFGNRKVKLALISGKFLVQIKLAFKPAVSAMVAKFNDTGACFDIVVELPSIGDAELREHQLPCLAWFRMLLIV